MKKNGAMGAMTGDPAQPRSREGFLEEVTFSCVPKDGWVENRMVDKHFSRGDLEANVKKMSLFLPQDLCTCYAFWLKYFSPSFFVRSWKLCDSPTFVICVTLAVSLH